MKKLLEKYSPLLAALSIYVIAQSLDFTSTALVGAFVKGAEEVNSLARTVGGQCDFTALLYVKLTTTFSVLAPLVVGLWACFKDWRVATIPVWWLSFVTLEAVLNNFLILWKWGKL